LIVQIVDQSEIFVLKEFKMYRSSSCWSYYTHQIRVIIYMFAHFSCYIIVSASPKFSSNIQALYRFYFVLCSGSQVFLHGFCCCSIAFEDLLSQLTMPRF